MYTPHLTRLPSTPVFKSLRSLVVIVSSDDDARSAVEKAAAAGDHGVESFTLGGQFLSALVSGVPCCVILDLKLPDMCGLDLQRHLADRQDLPVVFIAENAGTRDTVQAIKAGAVDVLIKPLDQDALLDTIEKAIDQSDRSRHDRMISDGLRRRYDSLTRREREVMKLVVAGLLNKQVAGELGISEITVKAHRGQVMRKMEAGSLADLVRSAMRLERPSPERRIAVS